MKKTVKLILRLPHTIDVEEFLQAALELVFGRYGKDGYFSGSAAPHYRWIKTIGKLRPHSVDISYYEIDPRTVEPAYLSAMETLVNLNENTRFYFLVDAKTALIDGWWRDLDAGGFKFEAFDKGAIVYDEDAAREITSTYDSVLASGDWGRWL